MCVRYDHGKASQMFGECVLTTAKRVTGSLSFGVRVLIIEKACRGSECGFCSPESV